MNIYNSWLIREFRIFSWLIREYIFQQDNLEGMFIFVFKFVFKFKFITHLFNFVFFFAKSKLIFSLYAVHMFILKTDITFL